MKIASIFLIIFLGLIQVQAIIPCGNSGAFCDHFQTCCQTGLNKWGCCPYSSGVCCSSNSVSSCCPGGSRCTLTGCSERFLSADDELLVLKKVL